MLRRLPAVLLLLGSTLGLALGASYSQAPAGKPPPPVLFSHELHVSEGWSNKEGKLSGQEGEYLRDCRGCHDYNKDVPASQLDKPTDRCVRCHDPDGYWRSHEGQILDLSKSRVDPAEEEDRLFKHSSHLENEAGEPIDCAECHYQKVDRPKSGGKKWEIRIPTDNSENKAYCTKCHDNKKPVAEWDDKEQAKRRKFNEGLTNEARRQAQARTEERLVFSHGAHLRPEQLTSTKRADCEQCHTSIKDSSRDSLAETQFDTNACSQCHSGKTFKSSTKREDGTLVAKVSETDGVFSHAQHLGTISPSSQVPAEAIERIGTQGCLACHVYEASVTRSDGVKTFTLQPFLQPKEGKGVFAGCISCHTNIKIPNHGNVDGCAQCHRIEPQSLTTRSALKSNRPLEQILRADPANFTFELSSHKFISAGSGKDAPSICGDCHLATLETQKSRIERRRFSHASHVKEGIFRASPADAIDSCSKCHPRIAKSPNLKDASATRIEDALLGSVTVNWEAEACEDCHGKAGATAAFEPKPRTETLQFNHEKHLGKQDRRTGKEVSCVDCHVQKGDEKQVEIVLAEKVAECTLCHGHGPDKINPYDKAAVDACAMCHAVGVPAKGKSVEVGRARLVVDSKGWQKHEGTQRCESCHQIQDRPFAEDSGAIAPPKPIEISVQHSLAGAATKESPHEPRKDGLVKGHRYFSDKASCVECHWYSTKLQQSAYWEGARDSPLTANWVREMFSDDRWKTKYRPQVGNKLLPREEYPSGFPGLGKPTRR